METNKLETVLLQNKLALQIIQEALKENPFVIQAKKVEEILKLTGLNIDELLQELVPLAKVNALPPISNYYVGAAGLGKSGNIYLGVNLEFSGFQLNQTVHGEQFLITLARMHGETDIVKLALSAAPCGHCRQFLTELGKNSIMEILNPKNEPVPLTSLLPKSFGPNDLGIEGGLLKVKEGIKSDHENPLIARAIEAAFKSYAPYSKDYAGVAINTRDGKIYCGSYLENAAFNPTLPPLQAALVSLISDKKKYIDIEEVVLVDGKSGMHTSITEMLVKSIAPEAKFHLEKL